MPFATFRGEKSVAEIADKLFVRLTPNQRKTAEAAILKANPQLGKIRSLGKGSVLRIPDLPDLKAKTNRNLENPDVQIAENIADTLKSFSKRLARQFETEQESIVQQSKLLSSAKFKKDLAKAPDLKKLANEAANALGERSKSIEQKHKKVKQSIDQVLKDLQGQLF